MTPSQSSQPAATITVTIDAFFPIGSIYPISSTLALTAGNPQVFNLSDDTLTITVAPSTPVVINYVLNSNAYVLLGIALNPHGNGAGRQEFPSVTLNRTTTSSQMAVTDLSLPAAQGINYAYVILVQEVATGNIGIIDPDIENEPQ